MFEKTLTLTSLNVRGLGSKSPKPKAIKIWLTSLPSPPQILLIQEHHLGIEGTRSTGKGLEYWKGGAFWNPRIQMGPTQRMSDGTAILVERKTAPLVVDSEILMEGRAQFIKLQVAGNGMFTIVNMYATQTSKNRALLWKTISKAELDSDNTIIGGDFNHQEETSRRGIADGRQMHRREATSWHHMTLQYGLTDAWCSDSFRKMSKKAFTFDNGRLGANSMISRIDKFMVSQDLDSREGRIESTITIRKFSDHSPFIISIWGQATGIDKPTCYFDTSLLEEEKSKAALLQAWAGDSLTPPNDQG
jgi:exonuclease III